MIQQFAELGQFYRQKEAVKDQLQQYAADPAAKFRTKKIILIVFTEGGFAGTQVEEYDERRKLSYLYRPGPPNGWDATATTGMPGVKKEGSGQFGEEVGRKLTRL